METESRPPRTREWQVDLGRMCLTMWGALGTDRWQERSAAPLTQAEHIREFGEPFGSNGA